MAFNPAEFAARLQALISGFNKQNSDALYANQNYNRTARKALVDMNTQYDKQAPQLVSGFGRRGMNSANVKSGAFSSAMQDFAKDRVSNTGEAQSAIDSTNAQYQGDLGERQAQLQADQLVVAQDKQYQIDQSAKDIMGYKAGAYA
jgi:hypothetical protein